MRRKEIRYLLFRIKTEADGGVEAPELPKGFKKTFSAQPKFRGWASFGISWDIGGRVLNEFNPYPDTTSECEDVWTVVIRDKTLDEIWNQKLAEVLPVIGDEVDIDD